MVKFSFMTYAYATGIATLYKDQVLDVWYPAPQLGEGDAPQPGTVFGSEPKLDALAGRDELRNTERKVVVTQTDLAAAPQDAYDCYLKLHLLSHRLVKPHGQNLDGIFGLLTNVVWTNFGPCSPEDFELTRAALQTRGPVTVYSVDKFPRMIDYVVPSGVRIGDADRVRLGAHLAPGTTVMHEGFVNFNAGTLGTSMVEGRISAGVVVDDGSDVGGGASIMGTLSGGGKQVISLGKRCLLGANSGCGIPLGDDCVIEAGLYVTAGSKVAVIGELAQVLGLEAGQTVKAVELAGKSGILFRRNSVSGALEAVTWKAEAVALNSVLHAN